MRTILRKFIYVTVLAVCSVLAMAANSFANDDSADPQVLMMGTFHFSNPGNDVVKTEGFNVMDQPSQAYLNALATRIVEEFSPTIVLLEYDEANDDIVQKRYQAYLNGEYELGVNEIYQVGFRVAKLAGGVPIASYDEREIHWDAQALFEVLETEAGAAAKAELDAWIEQITTEHNEMRQTMDLRGNLIASNDPERDRLNMDSYLMTNAVASEGGREGVDATASWWKRNFSMLARIQRHATPGARIFVIGGQGHTAILKGLLDIDRRINRVPIAPLF